MRREGLGISWVRLPRFAVLAIVVALVWLCRPREEWVIVGLLLMFLGAAWRTWCNGLIWKSRELCRTGPYAFVRHPMYLGTITITAGFLACVDLDLRTSAGILASVVLVCLWRMIREERKLLRNFGDAWREYRREVPMWVPLPWRVGRLRSGEFRWSRLRSNGEPRRLLLAFPLLAFFLGPVPFDPGVPLGTRVFVFLSLGAAAAGIGYVLGRTASAPRGSASVMRPHLNPPAACRK